MIDALKRASAKRITAVAQRCVATQRAGNQLDSLRICAELRQSFQAVIHFCIDYVLQQNHRMADREIRCRVQRLPQLGG